jgi:hypothetical protein
MYFSTLFNIPEENPVLNITYKEVQDTNGYYLIGSDGSVKNRTKVLKTYIINSGYEAIKLTAGGIRKHRLVHRLVAEAFVPKLLNKNEVNHIDGNKLNNNVCNLEWVSSSENKMHAIAIGLKEYNYPTKGVKLSSLSKYHNVGYDAKRAKWKAAIRVNGKTFHQKRFNTEDEAALHVNWALDQLGITDRPRNTVCS